MHFVTYVLIGSNTDIQTQVAETLEPFDEALKVAPYRDYLDPHQIKLMSDHYRIREDDLPALAKKMATWRDCPGGVDRRGLYATVNFNPDGWWDWYEIGGRWDKFVPYSRNNVIKAGTLAAAPYLAKCTPYHVVTPDSQWLARGRCRVGADGKVKCHEPSPKVWATKVRGILAAWPDHYVVCVDIHN